MVGRSYLFCLFSLFCLSAVSPTAHAVTLGAVGFGYGEAQSGISLYRIDLLTENRVVTRFNSEKAALVNHFELGFGVWDGGRTYRRWDGKAKKFTPESRKYTHTYEVRLAPVFRLESDIVYFELGIGPHLIVPNELERRIFSTTLQFGSLAEIGIAPRSLPGLELGFRVQHVSNGDISEPNPGIDFRILEMRWRFN